MPHLSELENAVEMPSEKSKLDAQIKKFLRNKPILACILQRFVPEFKDCSVEDIEQKYIVDASISYTTPVERDLTNLGEIEGISNEDVTVTEGRIYYDVLFLVRFPNQDNDEYTSMYINVEAQAKFDPGYPLETRAFFYAARRFSSQLKSISKSTDYKTLKKVYSIWLVVGDDIPDYVDGTATIYKVTKENIIGAIDQDSDIYDKMDVIMLRFSDDAKLEDELLKSLQTIFSKKTTKEQKLEGLRQLGIVVDKELESEVTDMCNYSDYIERSARKEGIEDTQKENVIRMSSKGKTVDEIADLLGLSEEKVAKILQSAVVTV